MKHGFKEGRGQPAHKGVVKAKGLAEKFDNAGGKKDHPGHKVGKSGALSSYKPGKGNIGPKHAGAEHPMAHPEVHHATHGGHEGHLGEHKLAGSHKISTRPMGAYQYHEVFGRKGK